MNAASRRDTLLINVGCQLLTVFAPVLTWMMSPGIASCGDLVDVVYLIKTYLASLLPNPNFNSSLAAHRDKMRLAEAVLFAEFDIDKGSTLRQSFPSAIPNYSPEFFADVMLPEGVHNRQQDFTIFFLNRQSLVAASGSGSGSASTTSPTAAAKDANVASPVADSSDGKDQVKDKEPLEQFMYCLNVVHTIHDANVRRGAKVKAVALCSRYKFCLAFKQILDFAVKELANAPPGDEQTLAILKKTYEVVNSVDVSGLFDMSDMEKRLLKTTLSASGKSGFAGSSASTSAISPRSRQMQQQDEEDQALFYHTKASWPTATQDNETNPVTTIPLKIRSCSTQDQHDTGLLKQLLLKFGDQTMVLYNAVLTGARVLVLGYNQPAGLVCSFVLSTSALVCPPLFGLIHRQYPYANLTDLGFLSTPGYIAGVTNPMFKTKKDWWDVLCDISTGEILLSTPQDKEEFDAQDKLFLAEVLEGLHAGFSEEWIRCKFEEYTRQNVVDIALGEAQYVDVDTQVKRIAMNNKRITKWARTENYKQFLEFHNTKMTFSSKAFNVEQTGGVDLRKHIRLLQSELPLEEDQVERIYGDFVALLQQEDELQEFLSYLPSWRGGLQPIAQGIFHPSISVKFNTVILLKRLESFEATASCLQSLNVFMMMSFQRIHGLVQPDTIKATASAVASLASTTATPTTTQAVTSS